MERPCCSFAVSGEGRCHSDDEMGGEVLDFCESEKVGGEGVVAPVADVVFQVAGGGLVGNGGGGDGLAGVEGGL